MNGRASVKNKEKAAKPAQSKREKRRQELLDAAAKLFAHDEYEATTIRDLAGAAKVPPSAFYYHFASKARLLDAVYRKGVNDLETTVAKVLEESDEADPWERLKLVAKTHVRMVAKDSDYAATAMQLFRFTDSETLADLTQLREHYDDVFQSLVDKLPLAPECDRRLFRLSLFGALNYTRVWDKSSKVRIADIGSDIVGLYQKPDLATDKPQPIRLSERPALDIDEISANLRDPRRKNEILEAAARLFVTQGFKATTMRQIAAEVGMLAGSLYHHFESKDDLVVAIYKELNFRSHTIIEAARARYDDPWERLEAACAGHLTATLDHSHYAIVAVQILPRHAEWVPKEVVAIRSKENQLIRELIDAVPLPEQVDRTLFSLTLFGAINLAQNWYGVDDPPADVIARHFVAFLRPDCSGVIDDLA